MFRNIQRYHTEMFIKIFNMSTPLVGVLTNSSSLWKETQASYQLSLLMAKQVHLYPQHYIWVPFCLSEFYLVYSVGKQLIKS